jgi:hypothetical protein
MKHKLPRFSPTGPTRKRGKYAKVPRLRVGLVSFGLVLATVVSSIAPPPASAQQLPKRSGYGTSRIAARPENKEKEAGVSPKMANDRAGEGGEPLPTPLTPDEKDGNRLVALAAKDVFRQRAIQAKVSQRVFAFGQEVTGAGEYYQFGSGQPKLLRLDMKMQVGPQAASLLQVCGRQDYWIRRHVPPGNPKLEHANLTRLASALSRMDDEGRYVNSGNWILLGGLSRLMESLHRNFDFAPPEQSRTLPVLVTKGRLKPDRFLALHNATGGKQEAAQPADQIPTSVILTLGLADQPLPHFPYRIEYQRQLSTQEADAAAGEKKDQQPSGETPLSILEFYEVHTPVDLDPQLFEFDPGDEEYEDRTQNWLRRLEE